MGKVNFRGAWSNEEWEHLPPILQSVTFCRSNTQGTGTRGLPALLAGHPSWLGFPCSLAPGLCQEGVPASTLSLSGCL